MKVGDKVVAVKRERGYLKEGKVYTIKAISALNKIIIEGKYENGQEPVGGVGKECFKLYKEKEPMMKTFKGKDDDLLMAYLEGEKIHYRVPEIDAVREILPYAVPLDILRVSNENYEYYINYEEPEWTLQKEAEMGMKYLGSSLDEFTTPFSCNAVGKAAHINGKGIYNSKYSKVMDRLFQERDIYSALADAVGNPNLKFNDNEGNRSQYMLNIRRAIMDAIANIKD